MTGKHTKKERKERFRRLLVWLLILGMLLPTVISLVTLSMAVSEDDIANARAEVAALEAKIAETKAELEALRADQDSLIEQKGLLDEQINLYNEQIEILETAIGGLDTQIAACEDELELLGAEQAEKYEIFRQRVRVAYEDGDITYLGVLLDSDSLTDFFDRVEMTSAILEQDQKLRVELEALAEEIALKQAALEADRADQLALKQELELARTELMAQQSEAEVLLAGLEEGEHENLMLVEEYERLWQEAMAEQERLTQEYEEQKRREEEERKRREEEERKRLEEEARKKAEEEALKKAEEEAKKKAEEEAAKQAESSALNQESSSLEDSSAVIDGSAESSALINNSQVTGEGQESSNVSGEAGNMEESSTAAKPENSQTPEDSQSAENSQVTDDSQSTEDSQVPEDSPNTENSQVTEEDTKPQVTITKYDLQKAALAIQEAELAYGQLLDQYEQDMAQRQGELQSLLDKVGEDTIYASFDGRVVKIYNSVGDDVREYDTIMMLVNEEVMLLRGDKYSNTSLSRAENLDVVIDGVTYDVTYIPYDEDEYLKKSMNNEPLPSWFEVEESEDISFGESGTVRLYRDYSVNTLVIPSSCIYTDDLGVYVYKAENGQRLKTYVAIGIETSSFVEIVDGLDEGDEVYGAE